MANLSPKTKSIIYSVLYLIVFIATPFLLLRFTMVIKDFGWYFLYYLVINPLSLVIYLILMKKIFKISPNLIFILFSIFTLINILIYIYLYIGISKSFSHIIGL